MRPGGQGSSTVLWDTEPVHSWVTDEEKPQTGKANPQLGAWPTTQACALTRNRTSNLSVCRTMPNPLSHTSQGGLFYFYKYTKLKARERQEVIVG